MPYAVLNLACRPVQIDHEGSYSIVDDGPRFRVEPMSTGDGPAIFPEFDEAEEWRGKRLTEPLDLLGDPVMQRDATSHRIDPLQPALLWRAGE